MKELGFCIYGSDNYRLNGPDSDKDYKVFLCPTFKDLYKNHRLDKTDLPREYSHDHYSPMDVRDFVKNLLRGNINCLEYVFSDYWCYKDDDIGKLHTAAKRLIEKGYVAACYDTFFASLEGMVKNSLDRYGVNRKSMSRAYYFYMFACTLISSDFRMTEATWRVNEWNKMVHEMRFDESAWMPSREELENTLRYVKEEGKKTVERMRKYQPELFEEFERQKNYFEEYAYRFVAKKLEEELRSEDF